MADKSEPLTEKQRSYNPTEDPVVQTTDAAYQIYLQFIEDLFSWVDDNAFSVTRNGKRNICIRVSGNFTSHDLPTLLGMDGITDPVFYTSGEESKKFNIQFVIEESFRIPNNYQPTGPDETYLKSLFSSECDVTVNDDQTVTIYDVEPPTQDALRDLESNDRYTLKDVSYRGNGGYAINVRWLVTDDES